MQPNLLGKKILIVQGSLLSARELEAALFKEGAKVQTVTNMISAFWVIERHTFDGAVIDKGLYNQAFDLCTELQALDVPYIACGAPHDLQKLSAKKRDTQQVVATLMNKMSQHAGNREVDVADFFRVDCAVQAKNRDRSVPLL